MANSQDEGSGPEPNPSLSRLELIGVIAVLIVLLSALALLILWTAARKNSSNVDVVCPRGNGSPAAMQANRISPPCRARETET